MKGLPNYTFPSDHLSLLAKFQMDISSKWQRKNILPSDSRSVFLNPLSVTFRFQPRLTVAVVLFSRPIVRSKTDDRLFIKISKTFEYYSKSLRNKSQMYVEGEKKSSFSFDDLCLFLVNVLNCQHQFGTASCLFPNLNLIQKKMEAKAGQGTVDFV